MVRTGRANCWINQEKSLNLFDIAIYVMHESYSFLLKTTSVTIRAIMKFSN